MNPKSRNLKILCLILSVLFFCLSIFGISFSAWINGSLGVGSISTGQFVDVTENTDLSVTTILSDASRQLVPVHTSGAKAKNIVVNKNCDEALETIRQIDNYDRFCRDNKDYTWYLSITALLDWTDKEGKTKFGYFWSEVKCFVVDKSGVETEVSHIFGCVVDILIAKGAEENYINVNTAPQNIKIETGSYKMRVAICMDEPETEKDFNLIKSARFLKCVLLYGIN